MKKVYRNQTGRPVLFRSGLVPAGGTGAAEDGEVSAKLIKAGKMVEVSAAAAPVVAEEAPTAPAPGAPPAPPVVLTIEEMAKQLAEKPDMLAEDDFTTAGVPEVAALEGLFKVDFTAAKRDELWKRVKELKDASNA